MSGWPRGGLRHARHADSFGLKGHRLHWQCLQVYWLTWDENALPAPCAVGIELDVDMSDQDFAKGENSSFITVPVRFAGACSSPCHISRLGKPHALSSLQWRSASDMHNLRRLSSVVLRRGCPLWLSTTLS